MWVDWMVLLLGRVVMIGLRAGRVLVAGAFSTRKWPVAPESEIACLIDLVTRCLSKMAAALGNWCRLFAWTIVFQAVICVGIFTFVGRM